MTFSADFFKYNKKPIFADDRNTFTSAFRNEVIKNRGGVFPQLPFNAPKSLSKVYKRYARALILKDNKRFVKRSTTIKNNKLVKRLQKDFELKNGRIERRPKKAKNKILINSDGDIEHVNKALPLMLEEFAEQKFTNAEIRAMTENKNVEIRGVRIIDEVKEGERINLYLQINFKFGYDALDREGSIDPTLYDITTDQLTKEFFTELIYADPGYAFLDAARWDVQEIEVRYLSTTNNSDEFKKTGLKLREENNLTIPNVNIDEKYKMTGKGNCVRKYLKKKWPKMSKKTINNLGNVEGVSTDEIIDFCKKRKIKCTAYDVNGRVLACHYPVKRNKNYGAIYYIAYNNHIYPLKGEIRKTKTKFSKIEMVDDGYRKLNEILNNGFLPLDIKATYTDPTYGGVRITSFIHNDTKYIDNDEYEECLEILKLFDLQDKIHDFVRVYHLGSIIETKYTMEEKKNKYPTASFWPNHREFIKGGYTNNYAENCDFDEEITTTDKNKSYSYALSKLPFLIKMDYRQNKINKINKKMNTELNITDHYLYIIDPVKSSILIPDANCYAGYELKYYHEQGLEFRVIEEMTTTKQHNYFPQMIKDVYNNIKNEKDAKNIINILIGKMEIDNQVEERATIDNIYNKEEIKHTEGFKFKINDDYFFNVVEKNKFNLYTRKPINIQIKDYARRVVYEKMVKMNLTPDKVVQIKTDSISFFGDIKQLDTEPTNKFYGWKLEDYKPIKKRNKTKRCDITFYQKETLKGNKLFNCYAGAGKTYVNINYTIPSMDSYRVLTPSHSTLQEYREEKMNACVSQCYDYGQPLPEEENIIFDECFLLGRKGNDLLYKLALLGKNIHMYGDDKQLLPVCEDSHFNSKHYLEYLFGKNINKMDKNFRNTFTKEYYDLIIDNKINVEKEVIKHRSKNWYDAEKIICYRNKTIDKYNKMYLERIGKKDMFFNGAYLRCTTNKLFKSGIYNNFYVTIKSINGDDITFYNGITLNKKYVEKYFKLGYAITLYGAQGKSFSSYYYPDEDMFFMTPRRAYTVISRIKN